MTAPRWRIWVPALGILIILLLVLDFGVKTTPAKNFTYTAFVGEVTANKISTATITSTGTVSGKLRSGAAYTSQIPTALSNTALSPLLLQHDVQVTGTNPSTTSIWTILEDLLPFLLIIGVFVWIVRRGRKQLAGGLGGIMGLGGSKVKVYDEERPSTALGTSRDTKDPRPR